MYGEILLLEPELAVAMEHEVDRLAVVFFDELLEFEQRAVECMVVVELDRAVQRDDLRRRRLNARQQCDPRHEAGNEDSASHDPLPCL